MLQCFGTSIKVITEAKCDIFLFVFMLLLKKNNINVKYPDCERITLKSYSRVLKQTYDLYDSLNKQRLPVWVVVIV